MPPPILFDLSGIDLNRVEHGPEGIERINPHRGVMRMLDGINYTAEDYNRGVAFKDIRPDEFWVPGHIPGRPIFPGVLQLEAAAQLSSFLTMLRLPQIKFMGFVGLDEVKFRGQVVPGDRLYILCQGVECRPRRSVCKTQGLVNGGMCFEATITGMPL
jgi:3-hydroxyacyl-[acyl-carrier-protein] dehydratase